MKALNRLLLRQEVRYILRDEGYPSEDINSAINRVISDINNAGRFRFHQAFVNISIVAGTYEYPFPETLLGDYAVIWAPFVENKQKIINKGSELIDAFSGGRFVAEGDTPDYYWIWGGVIYFDPIPNAVTAFETMSVFGFQDLDELNGDLDVSVIPARYHRNVLAYGAAAQIAPSALVRTASGSISVEKAYEKSFQDLQRQELWEPYKTHQFDIDSRFAVMHQWGNIGTAR